MSNISPKLIDVERNRVEFTNEKDSRVGTDKLNSRTSTSCFNSCSVDMKMYKDGGRFPTQLFTNNKKENFKYVKHIS